MIGIRYPADCRNLYGIFGPKTGGGTAYGMKRAVLPLNSLYVVRILSVPFG